MNKLLVREHIKINDDSSYFIELTNTVKIIEIKENTNSEILLYGKNINNDIEIIIHENSNLYIKFFLIDSISKIRVYLKEYNASINAVYSMLVEKYGNIDYKVFHEKDNTSSILRNHIVNYGDEEVKIVVDAYVKKNVKNSTLNQDNKIILINDGKGKIMPNLYIDEYTSYAKHSAYISRFNKDDLFYLMSRGIKEEEAIYLLTKSFLFANMNLDSMFLQKFTEVLQKIGR